MGSFDSGFKLGSDMFNQSERNRRQDVLDQRATDEYDYKLGERARLVTARATLNNGLSAQGVAQNTTGLSNASAAMVYGQAGAGMAGQQALDATAGMGNLEAARMGLQRGPEGQLPYNTSTPQEGPVPSAAPAASGLTRGGPGSTFAFNGQGPTDREINRLYGDYARASGDMGTAATLQGKDRGFGVQATQDEVARMPLADIVSEASLLNTNKSEYGLLYTGETKGGYKFTTSDPVTGKLGKEYVLNQSQMRGLVEANRLGAAGFGAEASTALKATNKDIFEHITKGNAQMTANVGSQNDALKGESDAAFKRKQGTYYDTLGAAATNRNKEVPQELVTKYNALADAWDVASPAERPSIERQMQILNTQMMTAVGKPRALGNAQQQKVEVTNKDLLEFRNAFGPQPSSFNDSTGNPIAIDRLSPEQFRQEAQRFFNPSAVGGGSGGAPMVSAPARGGAPAPNRPSAGMAPASPVVAPPPGRDFYGPDEIAKRAAAMEQGRIGAAEQDVQDAMAAQRASERQRRTYEYLEELRRSNKENAQGAR
jgi:hypothetical protein